MNEPSANYERDRLGVRAERKRGDGKEKLFLSFPSFPAAPLFAG